MKTIIAAAIAAMVIAPLPAQAEEEFGVAFAAPVVKDNVRKVLPGQQITLRLNITGKATTLTIAGPNGWQQDEKSISGKFESWPFAVTNATPPGVLKFKVKATSASGKTLEDSIEFLNVGVGPGPTDSPVQTAPNREVATEKSDNSMLTKNPTHSERVITSSPNHEVVPVHTSVNWIAPPSTRTSGELAGRSFNSTTVESLWQLEGTPVLFGAALRTAPEYANGNFAGATGIAPLVGLDGYFIGASGSYSVMGLVGLTADPWKGGLAKWPLQAELRGSGPIGEWASHDEHLHTDFEEIGGGFELELTLAKSDGLSFGLTGGVEFAKKMVETQPWPRGRGGIKTVFPVGKVSTSLNIGYVRSLTVGDPTDGLAVGLELRPLAPATPADNNSPAPPPSGGKVVKSI